MWKHLVNYKAVWNFLFYFLFYFTILYWFCHTLTWIFHGCTWVPNPEPPSHPSPHIISLEHPSAPAPSILYPALNPDWWFVSYMISYVSMPFSQIIPPSPSPTESKRLFYTSVSLLLSCIQGYQDFLLIGLMSNSILPMLRRISQRSLAVFYSPHFQASSPNLKF